MPRKAYVAKATARRKEQVCEARSQGAETKKLRLEQRWGDFYERQRNHLAGKTDEHWNVM